MAIAALERDGRAHCKATLVDSNLAVTAAHCVQDADQDRPDPRALLIFPDGTRRSIAAAATVPAFHYDSLSEAPLATIFDDVAIVALEGSVAIRSINLFSFDPDADGWVLVPAADGSWERCPTRSWPGGVVFWIGCTREPGESGTPVLRIEEGRSLNIVGVVVAQASTGGLFAHAIAPTLPKLLWATLSETTP